MSTARRRSLAYQATPQTPVASHSLVLSLEESQHLDENVPKFLLGFPQEVPGTAKAAFFILGAAMLLGWNGTLLLLCDVTTCVLKLWTNIVLITAIPYF